MNFSPLKICGLLAILLVFSFESAIAAPIQRAITISGSSSVPATFSDWTTADNSTTPTIATDWGTATDVSNNPGQFTLDGEYLNPCSGSTDLDCSTTAMGTGRDLRKFTYTWDSSNLYMLVGRYASVSSANDWWFYIDGNANGLMETGEIILNVKWTGANGKTVRQSWTYTPVRAGGDPLTCPATGLNSVADGWCPVAGEGDGYDMPGTITSGPTYATVYGGAVGGSGVDELGAPLDGLFMETFISWSDLGKTGPGSVGFHISSSNGTNLPTQLDDNMNGVGSGGSSISFSDLAITKTPSSIIVIGGDTFTYTLTVTNNGDSDATNIEVTDSFPAGTNYVSDDSASTGTSTSFVDPVLTWNIPGLTVGSSISLVITMTSDPVGIDTLISNTATITDQDQADPDLSNNTSTAAVITVRPAPDLTISKSHSGDFNEGQNGNYTLSVSNLGLGFDDGLVTVTDTLPVGLTYVGASGSGWTCGAAAQLVTCTNPGPVAAGGTLPNILLTVAVGPLAVPSTTNTATVSSTNFDIDLSNNSDSDLTTVLPASTQMCYAVANSAGLLTLIDTSDFNPATNETTIGGTGAASIQALAYDCGTGTLYGVDGGTFGTLNMATGSFSAIGAIGSSSNGSLGNVVFNDIRGLAFDSATGTLYASQATGGGTSEALIQIDRDTGSFAPNAFGAGVDYLAIGSISSISDIAIEQTGGQLFGVDNSGAPDQLITINKTTGTTAPLPSTMGLSGIVGMGSDGAGGLWGSTTASQELYQVNPVTGVAYNVRTIDNANDYGALDCTMNCLERTVDIAVGKTVDISQPIESSPIVYTITATNNGPDQATALQLTDILPPGVTFVSATPSQGSYNATSGLWYIGALAGSGSATLTINATVDPGTAGSTITNTASVSYVTQRDSTGANDSDSVDITPVNSNLSTSSKSALDVNGGALQTADIIRYTITLTETAGIDATGVSVTDNIPAQTGNLTVISFPAGATDLSTPGTGPVNITNITVPAGSSVTVVFEVTVNSTAPNGTTISNTAVINNPGGPGATVISPILVVSGGRETKQLYLDSANQLSRIPSFSTTAVTITAGNSVTWTMNPVSRADITLEGGISIPIPIWIENTNNAITVTAELTYNGGSSSIGTDTVTLDTAAPDLDLYTFSITPAADITVPTGTDIALTLTNNGTGNRDITVIPYNAPTHSEVDLNSLTIVNVDSVEFYTLPYPGGTATTFRSPGDQVYTRAVVSDPFGAFDISGATIEIIDADGTPQVVAGTPMTQVYDSETDIPPGSTRIYEYAYTLPAAAAIGTWQFLVTASEGTEGVTHTGVGLLEVNYPPLLTIIKSASSPTVNPGDTILYTIQIQNTGVGPASNVVIDDDVSPFTTFGIDSFGVGQPFNFVNGIPPSGLSLGVPEYSKDDGVLYTYPLVSGDGGANPGFDGLITNWRIPMVGTMNPGGRFTLQYIMQVR